MTAPRSVAAVLVTYDGGTRIERAVDALLAGTRPPDRTIVVDNASQDPETLAALDRLEARVEVVRLPTNTGFCAANNLGVRTAADAGVDVVLLCNPDAYATPGFLAAAVDHLVAHPGVGAVGPVLLGADAGGRPDGRIDSAGIAQTWYGRFVDVGQGRPAAELARHLGPADAEGARRDVVALCAAAVVVRVRALRDLEGGPAPFDERFFMYKEDVDLGLRLRRAGWASVLRPDLVVHHERGRPGRVGARRRADRAAKRRSLRNEWRIWARGTLSPARRATMLPYLCAKSLGVALGL